MIGPGDTFAEMALFREDARGPAIGITTKAMVRLRRGVAQTSPYGQPVARKPQVAA